MKRIGLVLLCAGAMLSACRKFKENPLPKDLIVSAETELSTADGFINSVYPLILTVEQKNRVSDFPVTATYKVNKKAVVRSGVKEYVDKDTLAFTMRKPREISVQPAETGAYRMILTFTDDDENIIGTKELNFNVQATDLNMYIVRDGQRVESMEEAENFLGYEGSFVVRINSEREDLNKGKLKLTANITGASVQVKNWRDRETKISQTDDLPETVDFLVEYKNVELGETKFVFTAESKNSSTAFRDSMIVQESKPGTLALNTTYHEEKNFYSRNELWVGQTDSVGYTITPDPKSVSDVFKIKFEMKDPTKLWFFDTGDPEQHFSDHQYEPNKWHDFTGHLDGKFYYVFPSPVSYADTVFISLQNGDMGPLTKYKLFVSCKQSQDFDFNVTFRPELVNGYDEIKLSELIDGINNPVELKVTDENPYSEFDVELAFQNMNELQRNIVQRAKKIDFENASNVPYGQWIGREYGYIKINETKSFSVVCGMHPTDQTASAYLENAFNWVYTIKRLSDGKTKAVTRQIKIIDDRMNFEIDMAPGNSREWVYQNDSVTAYQIKYGSPSLLADDYTLTVTSSAPEVADVSLMNKDLSFRKAIFDTPETPPASQNQNGGMLNPTDIGRMQIKGKEAGTATLQFTLKYKTSGAEKTLTKTVTTIADPVQYVIEPAPTMDAMKIERAAIPFNGEFHTYQNPRFKIRIAKESLYTDNTSNTASVIFSTVPSLTNNTKLYISENGLLGRSIAYDNTVELSYDKDYFVTVSAPAALPWNVPAGSEPFVNVKMIKAANKETPIIAEENNRIKYKLRAYRQPRYAISAEVAIENSCLNPFTETAQSPYYFYDVGVIVYANPYDPDHSQVQITRCTGTFSARNPILTATWYDAHQINGTLSLSQNGSYGRTKITGSRLEAMPGETPPVDYLEYSNTITMKHYYNLSTYVTDNWGYRTEVPVTVPTQITASSESF